MNTIKALAKLAHYQRGIRAIACPKLFLTMEAHSLEHAYQSCSLHEQKKLNDLVDYYCKAPMTTDADFDGTLADLSAKGQRSLYYVDFIQIMRRFPDVLALNFEFGDVVHIPPKPTFVKSRPIGDNNHNSVLLKLNSFRHYYHETDHLSFDEKTNGLVWRGAAHQPHRIEFLERHHTHLGWDVGCTSARSQGKPYHAQPLSLKEQMQYRFILSIEGFDVATNLKWIMASNSVCVMRRPRFETWYREGTLIPDHHYILVNDDYSDVDEKLAYYTAHPEKAKAIAANANAYFKSFLDVKRERLLGHLVAQRYFEQYAGFVSPSKNANDRLRIDQKTV